MEGEEYELLSHEKLERLKKELEHYKSNPFIKNSSDEKFFLAIKDLTKSVNSLIELFSDVKSELIKEYNEGGPDEKLERVLNQNKYIAEAVVALSEKLEKKDDSFNNQNISNNQDNPLFSQNNQNSQSNTSSGETYDSSYAFGPQSQGNTGQKEFDVPDIDELDINNTNIGATQNPVQGQQQNQNQGFQQNQQFPQSQGFQQGFSQQGQQQNQNPDLNNVPTPQEKDAEHDKKKKFLGFI